MALKEKLIDKAQKLIQKGQYDKAIAEYRAAAEADPRDISIRLRIGDLYVKVGRKTEAIKEYTEAARANAQRGFYLKAIAVYKQILKLDDSLEVHNKLAELYTKQRLIADAISEYSYIVTWYERRGKTNEVLELLKKMVEVDPDNIGVRLKLAELYQRLSFEKDSLTEYCLIFDKLLAQGKLDKAEKIHLGLHATYPADERIINGLCELYKAKGDSIQRVRYLKALLECHKNADRTDEAKRTALLIEEIKPNDPDAASFLKRSGKDDARPAEKAAEPPAEQAAAPKPAEKAPLISWPEKEIEVLAVGFGEAAPEAVHDEIIVEAAAVEEARPSAQQGTAPAEGEIEISIDDLIKGEIPSAGAVGAQTSAQPDIEEKALEEAPEIDIEIEVEAPEAASPEAEPVQEQVLEAGADEIEIDITPETAPAEEAAEIAEIEEIQEAPESIEEAVSAPAPEEITGQSGAEEPAFDLIKREPVEVEADVIKIQEAEAAEIASAIQEETVSPEALQADEPFTDDALPQTEEAAPASGAAQPEEFQEDISSAIDELMEKIEPAQPQQVRTLNDSTEEYVDLSAELGMKEALNDLAEPWGGNEPRETFDEFKTGIETQLNREDSETHYNLGIAYMEMELFAEASKEFKIALKDPRLEFDCYSRLNHCAMALGEPQEAVTCCLKGIKIEGRSIEERIGMMYELGLAYEAAGETEEAEELFAAIHEIAPAFREVAAKVESSIHHHQEPNAPLDDGLIEVELL